MFTTTTLQKKVTLKSWRKKKFSTLIPQRETTINISFLGIYPQTSSGTALLELLICLKIYKSTFHT